MKSRSLVILAAFVFVIAGRAWADQIILKDGKVYSGKFVRGDSNVVNFQILGRTESFKTADVAQIVFKEPELQVPEAVSAPAEAESLPLDRTVETPSREVAENSLADRGLKVEAGESPSQSDSLSTITLPVGTPLTVRTSTAIDTDRNRVGDVFDASLDEPLMFGDRTVAPRGSTVKGRIAYAQESGKLAGRSQLILELTELQVNGKAYVIRTSDYAEVGSSRGNRTAATVGGTAALGAVIGAIAGGGKGAAIGAASGAAVGTGVQVVTRGEVIRVPAETVIEFKLQSPLRIDAR